MDVNRMAADWVLFRKNRRNVCSRAIMLKSYRNFQGNQKEKFTELPEIANGKRDAGKLKYIFPRQAVETE